MKRLFKFLMLVLIVSLASCQSGEMFDDNTSNVEVQKPAEGVFRLYPKEAATTRAANLIYIDLDPNNKQVYYNFQSSTYTPQQIKANYKIEFFSSFRFDWLFRDAFDNIESYPMTNATGDLYWMWEQNNDFVVERSVGPKGKYSFAESSPSRWYMDMYDLYDTGRTDVIGVYYIPLRIKLTHKFGGPSFTYDLIQRAAYRYGLGTVNWIFEVP